MRRLPILAVAVLAAAFIAALIAHAGSAAGDTTFRTPDAGAACRVAGASLVCSSLGSPGSVRLRSKGGAKIINRLPWWDAATPVLHTWRHGTISCKLTSGAILCRNTSTAIRVDGAGFAVAG